MIVNWTFGLACFYLGLSVRDLIDRIEEERYGYAESGGIITAVLQLLCAITLVIVEALRLAGVLNG
jgi:hypothetical protein